MPDQTSDPTKTKPGTNNTLVQPGNIPIVLVPTDEPLPIPTVGGGGNDEDIEMADVEGNGVPAKAKETIYVTPKGDAIPIIDHDEGQDNNDNPPNKGKGPVTFDQEWLMDSIAGTHPLVNYDNRHPENISQQITDQMAGLDPVQLQEIRRVYGDIPVTTAGELLRRSQGEFGTSMRLRQLSTGLIINDEGAYNPRLQSGLDRINQTSARITMHSNSLNQRDEFFEKYLYDEEGFVKFLKSNFSYMTQEQRDEYKNIIRNLYESQLSLEADMNDSQTVETFEQRKEYEAKRKQIIEKIAELENKLFHDDNRHELINYSMKAYESYKRRRLDAPPADIDIETANINQLYEFLAKLNDTQSAVLNSIVEAELNIDPSRTNQLNQIREEIVRTKFLKSNCRSIVMFLNNLSQQLGGVDDPSGLHQDVLVATRELMEQFNNMDNFQFIDMISTITGSYLQVFRKHATNNIGLRNMCRQLSNGAFSYIRAVGRLQRIIENPDMTKEQVEKHIAEFRELFDPLVSNQTKHQVSTKYLRGVIKSKISGGQEISQHLIDLAQRMDALKQSDMDKIQRAIEARRRGEEIDTASLQTTNTEEEMENLRNLQESERMMREQLERLNANAEYRENYERLTGLCNEMLAELSALQLLSTDEDVMAGGIEERLRSAYRKIRQINNYIATSELFRTYSNLPLLENLIKDLDREKDEIMRHLQSTDDRRRDLEVITEQMKTTLQEAEAIIEGQKQEIDGMNIAGQSLHERYTNATEQLNALLNQQQTLAEQNGEQKQRIEYLLRNLETTNNQYQELQEAYSTAAREIKILKEGAKERDQQLSITSNSLRDIVQSQILAFNSIASTFTRSCVATYHTIGGDPIFTNPVSANYDVLIPFLNSSPQIDLLASMSHNVNRTDGLPEGWAEGSVDPIILYLLQKRYNAAYKVAANNAGVAPTNSPEVIAFRSLILSALTPTERAGYDIAQLLEMLQIQDEEMARLPEGYEHFFTEAYRLDPHIKDYFEVMSKLTMIIDLVNNPTILQTSTHTQVSSFFTEMLNSNFVNHEGMRVISDAIAMRVAKLFIQNQLGNAITDDDLTDEQFAERNDATIDDAYKAYRKALFYVYLKMMTRNGVDVLDTPLNVGLFDDFVRRSNEAVQEVYNQVVNTPDNVESVNDPIIQAAFLESNNEARTNTIRSIFEDRYVGDMNEAFNNVYLGMVQTYMNPQVSTTPVRVNRSITRFGDESLVVQPQIETPNVTPTVDPNTPQLEYVPDDDDDVMEDLNPRMIMRR